MSLFRSTSLVLGLALVACSAPTRDPQPALITADSEVAAPASTMPLGLDWLPGDIETVWRFPAAEVPFVAFFRRMLGEREPACVAELVGKLTVGYKLDRGTIDKSLWVVEGDWQRDDVEACIDQVAALLKPSMQRRREGAITILSLGQNEEYLGWAGDKRIFWQNDRARVEKVLDTNYLVTSDHPLAAVLPRINPKVTSVVSIADFTSPYLDVPGAGLVVHQDLANKKFVGWLLFATPEIADQALQLLQIRLEDGTLAGMNATLAGQLYRVTPRLDGREITADLMPIIDSSNAVLD